MNSVADVPLGRPKNGFTDWSSKLLPVASLASPQPASNEVRLALLQPNLEPESSSSLMKQKEGKVEKKQQQQQQQLQPRTMLGVREEERERKRERERKKKKKKNLTEPIEAVDF